VLDVSERSGVSTLDKVMEVSLRRGLIFPTAEIYGGFAGVYDFGPIGSFLRENLINFWLNYFVKTEVDPPVYLVSGGTVLPFEVLKASGHVDHFVDPIVECPECKTEFRADHLIEEATGQFVEGLDEQELTRIIRENNIKCPNCDSELADVTIFNLMLATKVGAGKGKVSYLRPETAQIMFLDFKRTAISMRAKLPFGIAQVGSSYRNEISPRKGLIRLREFGQMEIEMFVDPAILNDQPNFAEIKDVKLRLLTREGQDKEPQEILEITADGAVKQNILPNQYFAYYLAKETIFYTRCGIPWEKFRFRHMKPEETPHYSGGNWDLEIELPRGEDSQIIEIVGNAYRRDYDLGNHAKHSGEDLSIDQDGEKLIAHVVEPSFGVDRSIHCILEHCYREKGVDRDWIWFQFPNVIAPISVEVYPLMRKDGMPEKAQEIYVQLKKAGFNVLYDQAGSIGRRYARADEIGCPYCLTIDYATLDDDTVTIRDRDSMKQNRVTAGELIDVLRQLLEEKIKFEEAGQPI
jgi:glycyl-tRNA synthetase